MSTTRDIQTRVFEVLDGLEDIRTVYNGSIPPHTSIRHFPSVAIDYAEQQRRRSQLSGCAFDIEEEIDLYLYVKVKNNRDDDITADLVEIIDTAFRTDELLNSYTIDHYINTVMRDGGILDPFYITRLTLYLQYRVV